MLEAAAAMLKTPLAGEEVDGFDFPI